MKTNLRLSSKMHLLIVISALLIAAGLAVGLICQFVGGGYFNYSAEWGGYKSITVTYGYTDFSGDEDVKIICQTAFDDANISYYAFQSGDNNTGGQLVYKFAVSTDDAKITAAVEAIEAAIKLAVEEDGGLRLSSASAHTAEAYLGGGSTLVMLSVALAVVVAFHFLYFVIRFRLTMALAALLADIHNLALFVSLLSLTRVPVGPSVFAFAALAVLLTVIGTCWLFDRVRKNAKEEEFKKLSAFELVDRSADEAFKANIWLPASLVCVTVVLFVLLSVSSLSPLVILSPVLTALVCFVSCAYGTAIFTPSVYARFKKIGDEWKSKNTRTAKAKNSDK